MDSCPKVALCPPIRAVLFDIGGVFLSWPAPAFFTHWATLLSIPPDQFQQRLWHSPDVEAANTGAIPAEEYYRRCAGRLGVDAGQIALLIEAAFAGEPLNDTPVAYVSRLRSRVRLAALTNTWSFGRTLLERRGIRDMFDLIVTSAEEGVKKPDERIYAITVARLGLTPAEVIFIDDSEENITTARALGLPSIQFHATEQTIAELEARLMDASVFRT
jgi:putative hydrolase of the HAD superfamily